MVNQVDQSWQHVSHPTTYNCKHPVTLTHKDDVSLTTITLYIPVVCEI